MYPYTDTYKKIYKSFKKSSEISSDFENLSSLTANHRVQRGKNQLRVMDEVLSVAMISLPVVYKPL